MKWWIGCSGFHYKDWRGTFYPETLAQSKWFDYYCDQFNSLELNVTFYRFPQLSFLQNWYNKSPEQFSFAVKAPRLITHYKQFVDITGMLGVFYRTAREGLREKCGPVLFQLPERNFYTEERLQRIIESMDTSFVNVVEFRHRSWWNKKVYQQLAKHNITFCSISHPNLPDDVVVNTPLVYYRFHGVPRLYYSQYKRKDLQRVTDTIIISNTIKEAYVYFNNTASVAAIKNANWLKNYCFEEYCFEKEMREVINSYTKNSARMYKNTNQETLFCQYLE
jgi:uncharacterized protein YecE (DUF72 family)